MEMELRQLTTFVRVAQFQSFSKAAASLGYSQSAVTVQIRLLEEELQVRLFDRMGKRVSLTGKGRIFLDSALNIMQDINKARLSLSGTDEVLRGQLHIGTLESLCYAKLPGIMRKFRIEHPQVCVQITTGTPEELIAQMERGELDIIYILEEPLYNNSWCKVLEKQEKMVLVASASLGKALHPQAGGSVGQTLLPHRAGRQLPAAPGPPPGRGGSGHHSRPGKQLRLLPGARSGADRGAFLLTLVSRGGTGPPGQTDGGGGQRPERRHVRSDLLPPGQVDHP